MVLAAQVLALSAAASQGFGGNLEIDRLGLRPFGIPSVGSPFRSSVAPRGTTGQKAFVLQQSPKGFVLIAAGQYRVGKAGRVDNPARTVKLASFALSRT